MDFLEELLRIVQEAAAQPKTNSEDGEQAPDPIAVGADAIRTAEHAPDLAELEAAAIARFDELRNGDDFNGDAVPTLTALADVADAVRTVAAEKEQEREELASQVEALANRVNPAEPAPDTDETTAESDGEAPSDTGDSGSADDASGDGSGDTSATDTTEGKQKPSSPADEGDGGAGEKPPAPAESGELVTASTKPAQQPAPRRRQAMPTVRQIQSQRQKKTTVTAAGKGGQRSTRRYTVTAAADVPRVPSGKELTPEELTAATLARFQAMPVGQRNIGQQRNGIALIHRDDPDDRVLDGRDVMADAGKIDAIAEEKNLPGGSLANAVRQNITAATSGPNGLFTYGDVYCIPSETDYTLCEAWATREGLIDLPTASVNSAGIRYPVWPQWPDQNPDQFQPGNTIDYPDAPEGGWTPDNSTGLADPDYFESNPKDRCLEMPCPEWVEERMNLDYVCLTGNILQQKMWPQLVQRWISDALTQQAHFMDGLHIQEIVARSDALAPYDVGARFVQDPGETTPGMATFANGSLASGLLDHLLLVVAWMRNRYKMGRGVTLDGFAPDWFRDMIKLDLEKKNNRPYGSVSNAEVDGILASAGARIQWLYNYQPLGDGDVVDGRVMPPLGWPTQVELVLFPAGSWVLGQQDIITLDALYDSTLLRSNKFTQLFVEEGWLLINRCNRSFRVTLTDICVNGATGPLKDVCGGGGGTANAVEVTNFPSTQRVSVSNTPSVKVSNTTTEPVPTQEQAGE